MKHTIKAMTRGILTGIGLMALLPTHAAGGLFDCGLDGCWEVGGEALWWKPCVCDFDFATITNSSVTPDVQSQIAVKPDYDWGFRIWVGNRSDCNCYFLNLGWTYLKVTNSKRVEAGDNTLEPLFAFSPNASTTYTVARARLRHHYNKVNLRGGHYLFKGCNTDFYTFAGLRWVDIEQNRQIFTGTTLEDFAREKETAEFKGVGLELGVGGEYHIGCGFNLAGYAGLVTVLGDQRLWTEFRTDISPVTGDDESSDLKFPTSTHCVPGVELRLGFNYTYECQCVTLTGEIGYQLDYYYGALENVIRPRTANTQVNGSTCENVGFGGLYLGLALCF